MKLTPLTALSVLIGAITLLTTSPVRPSQAEESNCPDEFEGISLSAEQVSSIDEIEEQLDATLDDIMPISPEIENQIDQLEDKFDSQVHALFSAQQQQQIEQIEQVGEEDALAIAPGLFEETEDEPMLTPQQEIALDALEEEYENRIQAILTPEQVQQIETLEKQLEEDIEAMLPEPDDGQIARIESAEADAEQRVLQLLTVEQRQQLENNLACDAS